MNRFHHVKDVEFLHRVISVYEREITRLVERITTLVGENAKLKGEGGLATCQLELGNLQKELERLHKQLLKARNQASEDAENEDGQSQPGDGVLNGATIGGSESGEGQGPGEPDGTAASGTDGKGKKRKPRTRFGHRPQPLLPVEECIHRLDGAELLCPLCERERFELNGLFEISEEIHITPPKVVLRRHLLQKYGCDNRCTIVTAKGPVKLFPGARYSPDFALEVAQAKYLDHTPRERQVRRFARLGLTIDSQTLFDQLFAAARLLGPTVAAIYRNLKVQERLHVDETPWHMLSEPWKGQWTMWTLTCEHAAYFSASSVRSSLVASVLLKDFEGIIQCDAAPIYTALVNNGGENARVDCFEMLMPDGDVQTVLASQIERRSPAIVLADCWSHVLRRYRDCQKDFPRASLEALTFIRKLYATEEEAVNLARSRAGPAAMELEYEEHLLQARGEMREAVSKEVLAQFQQWLRTPRILASTSLGQAIGYTLNNWTQLTVFLSDPTVVLDNNAAERALRQPVVGRKVHYGSHSPRGIRVACAFYTLFESARLNGLNPVAYVRQALQAALLNPGTVTLPWIVAQQSADAPGPVPG